jgi:PAS domain S-box-containing protein
MLMAELQETSGQRSDEGAARDSERQPRPVTDDNICVAIAYCDTEARYRFVNRHYAERHGLTPEQVVGRRIPEVVGEKAWAAFEPYFRECLAGRAIEFEIEDDSHHRPGESQFLRCRYEPEWSDGRVIGLIAESTNIPDLECDERCVRANDVTFRQLVENSPFGILVVDANFRIVHLSAGAANAFRNVRPVIGRDLAEALRYIWPEPFASDVIGRIRHTLDTGEPHRARAFVQQRRDTGAVEAYDWQTGRLTMPDGRSGVVVYFYDFSERQKYETALRESEETFRVMFDVSSVGKIEVDPETTRFLRANAAMCELLGYSEAELLARTVLEITHPDDRDRDRELGRRLVAGESQAFDVEKRYVRKDGNIVWARTTVNVVRDAFGRPLRNIAVIQDLNARKRVERDLEASKDRLQFALDAALLGWWQYDPLRRVVSGDERWKDIFDVSADRTPIEEIIKRVRQDYVEIGWAALEAALDPVDPKRSATEFPLRRRDGNFRWMEVCGLAYFEGTGPERRAIGMVGTAQDITERKEREARERLLLREVNHRAKNMLSVVNVIARQTAAKNPDDFIERFSERIQALSANQDLLVRNEWEGVGIEDLVRAQLSYFHDLIGSRIIVDGSKLRLNAASAQAIGLALHELATNAGKYGALSADRGCVDICWRVEDSTFTMSWSERNGPPVSRPTRPGFGTVVVEEMMAYSMDGAVDLDYAPSGLCWRLACPAVNALEFLRT